MTLRLSVIVMLYACACTREAPVTVYVGSDGACRYAATGGEAPSKLCGNVERAAP